MQRTGDRFGQKKTLSRTKTRSQSATAMFPSNNGSSSIELFRPNQRVSELLDNLGVAHLFKFVNAAQSLPEKVETMRPVVPEASREELCRTCLEAHLTLMDINPANVPKFKEVAKFLAEDLEKLQAQKS